MPLDAETKRRLPSCLPETLLQDTGVRQLLRGERLVHLGDRVEQVYFVTDGELKAVRYQPDGRESIMLRSGAGESFGESALIVDRYVCDAFGTRESRVAALPARRFRELLNSNAEFAAAFAGLMAAAARRQCSRYERLGRARVLHLLSCEADTSGAYPLNGPLVDLTDELGLEPETLYRVLKELTRNGVIARTSSSLQLLASR